ncbi:MAG: type VI secretion system baseplate subunit TssF [Polyangiaceae bacterium]
MFNKYYQDELAYLRQLGKEFAEAYPALGPMLADRGADPDVERLLEGVAFLTGRIRQKLDDELPELMLAIAGLLFPHLTRPLPGAAILELELLPNVLRERKVVPQGSEFLSVPVDGTPCRFTSCADCEVVPWAISDVRLEPLPDGSQQLRIDFRCGSGIPFAAVAPERLRLHLAGEARVALGLLHWIHEHTRDVVLIETNKLGGREQEISIGKKQLHSVGFDEDEALLPYGDLAFPGFRLLEEYYVLPQKFAYVDITNTARLGELKEELTDFAIAIRFDAPMMNAPTVTKDSVKLHCVPVINLFKTTAEPIRLVRTREQFLVRPAGLQPGHGEVYQVLDVEAITRGASERVNIPSFFDFTRIGGTASSNQVYYSTHLRAAVIGTGADTLISFGTPENSGVLPQADVISIDLTATNQRLASALRPGEIRVPTPTSPPFAKFKNIGPVTTHVPPPLGRDLQWRVTAHAAMNLRSLAEKNTLRAMLGVYNLHGLVDRQAARANDLRIQAIQDVQVRPAERLYRGAPVRGLHVEVSLEENGFTGDGDMFLFGVILERLFASYVSLNSFTSTTVHGVTSKVKFEWPARSGNLTIL